MALEVRKPSLLSRVVRRLIVYYYRRRGWRTFGVVPDPRRCVIIAAPHTSNWDFVNFIGITEELGVMPHFMGKMALFRWPLRNFMLDMGGVPVDRSSSKNYVEQMIAEFEKRDEFMLTVAPEGTRSSVGAWKTGFYHIAIGAKVPLVVGYIDYANKRGGFGELIWPTGDYEADMQKVIAAYANASPKHPEKGVTDPFGKALK
jgi:1-acyl-sn-glycerol-3-phosphate acyltransferase